MLHMEQVIEASYPLSFREEEASVLGQHLRQRRSVVLIGMKRVGISSFLRFFLYHKGVIDKYFREREKHLFIPVDLNDLVERELFPFWTLTLKRVVDSIEKIDIDPSIKKHIEGLFLDSIQSQKMFLTIDSLRKSLVLLAEAGITPTLFFIRFDRVRDALTPEFFSNLQGLKEATHQKLAYVFTGYRNLPTLAPAVFSKAGLSVFSADLYIRPAQKKDTQVILQTYAKRYGLKLPQNVKENLFDVVDGYVQYLQLSLIVLQENKEHLDGKSGLFDKLVSDERIMLQSEELWESLEGREQEVLLKASRGKRVLDRERVDASYLWETGFIVEKDGKKSIFSGLFESFLKKQEKKKKDKTSWQEFTKKEKALFSFLERNLDKVCEREDIIEAVWPEVESFGVSDWAIDRLVARVRGKLKEKASEYEIQTVKTRGYKLIAQEPR